MKLKLILPVFVCFCAGIFINASAGQNAAPFQSSIEPIPSNMQQTMQQYTWHAGCPAPLSDLAYIRLTYWGYDHQPHLGELIVNKQLANETVKIFKDLYEHHYPIQSMKTMDVFKGDDDASLAANNTAAFNCRPVTGQPGVFSQHSYGRAIDINPLINPYVKGTTILPPTGAQYVDRSKAYPGKITKDSFIYREFTKNGWDWGGNWHDLQDYQHFEKRAGGKKRDVEGYSKK
jgi:hypothetical protein